jgi:hypothetical protein
MTSCTTVRPPNSLLHAPVIVLDACGKGVERTPTFITGDEWAAAFTFDCTAVGGPGVFQANAYSATGAKVGTLEATLANESRTKSKGVVPVHATPGAHYVSVSTACAWTLRITSYN